MAPQISLTTAVGVCAGLQQLGYNAGIKWPNDIYIDGRKVCGMLTEMHGSMESVEWVVVWHWHQLFEQGAAPGD